MDFLFVVLTKLPQPYFWDGGGCFQTQLSGESGPLHGGKWKSVHLPLPISESIKQTDHHNVKCEPLDCESPDWITQKMIEKIENRIIPNEQSTGTT